MEYQLTEPVRYAQDGQMTECEFLILSAPKGKRLRSALREVRFYVNKAFIQIAEMQQDRKPSGETPEAPELDENEAIAELLKYAFQNGEYEDYKKFINAFGDLVCGTGVCKLAGHTDLLRGTWDDIEDQDDIAMRYCANFGIGYLEKMQTTSEKPSE